MGYGILSEDMLAICLLVAKGDVTMPMGEVVYRVEEFQREHGFFGVSDTDFRSAFMHLAEFAGNGTKTREDIYLKSENPREIFDSLFLRDFIMPVLGLCGIWFNDEGEAWEHDDEYPPTWRNRLLKEYFSSQEISGPENVMEFLHLFGWDADNLHDFRCSGGNNFYDEWVFWNGKVFPD